MEDTMGRAFPQSLPQKDYPQNHITGLRSYQNEDNDIIHFAYDTDLNIKDTVSDSTNSPYITSLNNDEYIYKKSYMSTEH